MSVPISRFGSDTEEEAWKQAYYRLYGKIQPLHKISAKEDAEELTEKTRQSTIDKIKSASKLQEFINIYGRTPDEYFTEYADKEPEIWTWVLNGSSNSIITNLLRLSYC